MGQEMIFCNAMYPSHELEFPAVECSDYQSKHDSKLKDMEKIAWVVTGRGRYAGFISPDKFKEDHPGEDPSSM